MRKLLTALVIVTTIAGSVGWAGGAPPRLDDPVKFAVIGDSGTGDTPEFEVARQMATARNRFPFELGGERYYTFARKDVRLIVLDTNAMDHTQLAWLESQGFALLAPHLLNTDLSVSRMRAWTRWISPTAGTRVLGARRFRRRPDRRGAQGRPALRRLNRRLRMRSPPMRRILIAVRVNRDEVTPRRTYDRTAENEDR